MTFTEIVTEVMDRLNLTSSAATTRVGRAVNRVYREVGTAIGLSFSRTTAATKVVTVGNAEVTFTSTEKILTVWTQDASGNPTTLDEVLLPQLREDSVLDGDKPTEWALKSATSTSVTIRLNRVPVTAYTLYADVIADVSDLSGATEPALPKSFHDILVEGVLRDEYLKLEKDKLAKMSAELFERRLSDLRMFIAKSNFLTIQQDKIKKRPWTVQV